MYASGVAFIYCVFDDSSLSRALEQSVEISVAADVLIYSASTCTALGTLRATFASIVYNIFGLAARYYIMKSDLS